MLSASAITAAGPTTRSLLPTTIASMSTRSICVVIAGSLKKRARQLLRRLPAARRTVFLRGGVGGLYIGRGSGESYLAFRAMLKCAVGVPVRPAHHLYGR